MEILKAQRENLKKIAKLLKSNKVIIFPTDTLYGLIAKADSQKAVSKVFELKKREISKPVPVFVSGIKMAKNFVKINKKQEKFLEKVWPGQVTVILKSKNGFPNKFFKETVGLRYPNYPMLHYLFKEIDFPITGTSANISGEKPVGNFKKIIDKLPEVDAALDGGMLPSSEPSTVIDISGEDFSLIRKGRISENELRDIYKEILKNAT